MSRRPPSDTFTRFTSTSPHASQNPTSFSSQPPSKPTSSFNVASPDGETPAQKVARLRAASRLAKERGQMSGVDRMINRGRIWADRAHRITTYGLIGITGVATVVSIYSLTSLVTHNRRQKRAWIEREMDRLHEAQTSFLRGTASAEQLHLLEQERAGEEMASKVAKDKQRRKQDGIWSKLKGMVKTGTAVGEMGHETPEETSARETRRGGRERLLKEGWVDGEVKPKMVPVAVAESGIRGVGVDEKGRPVPMGKMKNAEAVVEQDRRTGEREATIRTRVTGGPLDVMAGNIASTVTGNAAGEESGWLSWIRGSKS